MEILLAWQTTGEWKKAQSLSNVVLEAGVELALTWGMLNWKVGNEAENKTVIYSTTTKPFVMHNLKELKLKIFPAGMY